MKIYVGNLSHDTTEDDLSQAFEAFGQVISVNIVRGRARGDSKGYGFVGMPISDEGQTAISELNGKDWKGHIIKIEEGRMKTKSRASGGRRESFGRGRADETRRGGFGHGRPRY